MFIPYKVDVPFNHRPVTNWLLVASIIVVFFLEIQASDETIRAFVLEGWNIKGLFGHIWLHAGLIHLFGNMLFLWLFGNAVCSKVGNIFYIPIFLGVGLISAASHLIFDGRPAIGASGAINGIVGMYLVFFPENVISNFFWLIFFFTLRVVVFSVSGMWIILLWFAFDIFGALRGHENIAYVAHIGGFLGGVCLAVLLLKLNLIVMERDEKSLLQMLASKGKKRITTGDGNKLYRRQEIKTPVKEEIKSEIPPIEHPEPKEEYIRFNCQCGQKIKVPQAYAGRTGRCPKCSSRITIPQA